MKKNDSDNIHDILLRVQSGDFNAFRQLFEQYKTRVYSVAFGILCNVQNANDVTQQVFVKLYRSISGFDVNRNFFTYLYKITVNTCFDFLRKQKNRADPLDANRIELPANENPGALYDEKELRAIIGKLASRLSPRQRTVFVLRHIEGLKMKEIEEILNCNTSTVRTNLYFSRQKMKMWLEKEYPEFLED